MRNALHKLLFPREHRALIKLSEQYAELEQIALDGINEQQRLNSEVDRLEYEKEDLEIALDVIQQEREGMQ
jgi:hypothetical protein